MRIQWIGGPSFLLELGSFDILCDPVLGEGDAVFTLDGEGKVARRVAVPPLELADVDLVLVSRDRDDHVDETAVARLDPGVTAIVPADSGGRLAQGGFAALRRLGWWEEVTQSRDGETLTIMAVPTRQAGDDTSAAESNGYLIAHSGDKPYQVYWTGDTLWFSGARDIKDRAETIDLFLPHLGGVGAASGGPVTLTGKEAMQFVFMFQPKRVLPINHNTFSHYTESIDDFRERIALTMYDRRLVVLKEGEVFERT